MKYFTLKITPGALPLPGNGLAAHAPGQVQAAPDQRPRPAGPHREAPPGVVLYWIESSKEGVPQREIGFDAAGKPVSIAVLAMGRGTFVGSGAEFPDQPNDPALKDMFHTRWRWATRRIRPGAGARWQFGLASAMAIGIALLIDAWVQWAGGAGLLAGLADTRAVPALPFYLGLALRLVLGLCCLLWAGWRIRAHLRGSR